jgi:8-oxo-dGTP pyrophosphatase MutT (NUDIX family)
MHRNPLKQLLQEYRDQATDIEARDAFLSFVDNNASCFKRSLEDGHITASAWIVDPERNQALLVLHKKLGLWLQPGGHCDGDPDVVQVAKKEVEEETGLEEFRIFSEEIFDLDIHEIPMWKSIPSHYHYDVRFLIYANSQQPLIPNDESNDLRWIDFSEVSKVAPDDSVIRLLEKARLKLSD